MRTNRNKYLKLLDKAQDVFKDEMNVHLLLGYSGIVFLICLMQLAIKFSGSE